MDPSFIHGDRSLPALEHGQRLPWQQSPEAGIERRMLERIGGEVAIATSIVRYAPGRHFPPHVHELGEEFLVLDGTFQDEHGEYPAGTYVRNPPGSRHAPFSDHGCVIFVKLRQMHPAEKRVVRVRYDASRAHMTLFEGGGVTVSIERLAPGAGRPSMTIEGGEELFVVEGQVNLVDREPVALDAWSWFRRPGMRSAALASLGGALYWIKRGHLSRRAAVHDC